jgi:hypothetical protein
VTDGGPDPSPMIIQGPDLPVSITNHCVVNSDNVMKAFIIGGIDHGVISNATHIFSFDDQTWQQGPPLTEGRIYHACGILKDGNDYIIVVAGGIRQFTGENFDLRSVELYNLGSGTSWYAGPEMANSM